jgi:cysteinyl-tRNA synthetase
MEQLQSAELGEETFTKLKENYVIFFEDILGLKSEQLGDGETVVNGMLNLYKEYKEAKNYGKVDEIRAYFKANNMVIKDLKHCIDWAWDEN